MEGDFGSSNTANTGTKHFKWTSYLDEMLVQSMMELFNNREFEKKDYQRKLQTKMEEKCPGSGIKAYPHIQSRLKTMKTNWSAVYDLVHGANASGFGWDSNKQCVYAEDAVWNEYIKSKPKAAAWRHKPFPHFDDLSKVWAKDRATGIAMEDENDMFQYGYMPEPLVEETTEAPLSVNEEVYSSEMSPEQGPEASSSSSKKRKRANLDRDEKYVEALKDMSRMMDLSIKEVTKKLIDRLCASFDRSANEDVLIVEELLKVVGFTPLELCRAHAELKSSKMLWILFNDTPIEKKAEFLRDII